MNIWIIIVIVTDMMLPLPPSILAFLPLRDIHRHFHCERGADSLCKSPFCASLSRAKIPADWDRGAGERERHSVPLPLPPQRVAQGTGIFTGQQCVIVIRIEIRR